ncbi:hypothetical protein [Streptomyces hokutonensis]|uniref:hypothetical protein n=1 Tax=Streptomyces hokutonensis TaxID=1306990 RepID=UPI000375318A|nr:hypothetical protein [Streptomyces hokutonensis]
MSERENDITAVMEAVAYQGERLVPISELPQVEVLSEVLEFARWQGRQLRERPADAYPIRVASRRMACLLCPVWIEPGDVYVSVEEDEDATWRPGHLSCVVCPVCRRFVFTSGGVICDESGEQMGCIHLPEGLECEEVEDDE